MIVSCTFVQTLGALLTPATTLAADEHSLIERLWYAQGHLHPIVVHFPIALIMAAAIAAALRPFTKRVTSHVIFFCLLLGTGGAILSSLAGWAWAPQVKIGYDVATDRNSPIFLHRWGGITVTVLSLGVLIWAALTIHKHASRQWPWQAAVIVLAMGVGWVGHEGGELVYPDNAAKVFGIASGTRKIELFETASTPSQSGDSLFATKVLPIFQRKCIDCHGPSKQKSGLRLDTEEWALKGGDHHMPLYVAGNPNDSALIKYVTAPDDDAEPPIMPPTNAKRPVTAEEVAILKQWISEGASWSLNGTGSKTVTLTSIQRPVQPATTAPSTAPAKSPTTARPIDRAEISGQTGTASGSLFATKVWPIFENKCIECHGPSKQKGKLRLDQENLALAGGDSKTPLYVKGKSADSDLIKRVTAKSDDDEPSVMPPEKAKKPVTADEVQVLKKWIDQGAVWDKK